MQRFLLTLLFPAIALAITTQAVAEMTPTINSEGHSQTQVDIPEEILRTELILEGRSPLDGTALSPEDYAALEQRLTQPQNGPLPVNAELRSLVFQLKLLNLVKTVLPGLLE